MPIAAPRTVADRVQAVLDGTHPWIDGSVTMTPSNFYTDYGLKKKNASGAPEGWTVKGPPVEDGYFFFLSEADKFSSIACQSTDPLPVHDPVFTANEPWVPGHAPM